MMKHRRVALTLSLLLWIPAWVHDADADGAADHGKAATTQHATIQTGAVRVRAALSNGFYSTSTPSRLVLRVDMTADAKAAAKRSPLNLALVIDRSGSMGDEGKFGYAMSAARMVVQNLTNHDVISLIAFNDQASVIAPAARAVNKKFLNHRLEELKPEGYTNLSAGLLEAFAQIDASAADGQTRRVIVLTDGIANRGVTGAEELQQLAAAAKARKIGISTIGVGTEFDGPLLTAMAEAGGGRYTYARTPEQIPEAISRELSGLLTVVAQNVRLEIRADEGTRLVGDQGQPLSAPSAPVTIPLGDVRSGEQGVFLFDLAPALLAKGKSSGVTVVVTLDRPDTGRRERKTMRVVADFTAQPEAVQRSEDKGVRMYASLLAAVSLAEDALLGRDVGGFEEAATLFGEIHEQARRVAQETRDQALLNEAFALKHFMGELEATRQGGGLHEHDDAWAELKNTIDYRRYLRQHHRPEKKR